MEIFNFKSFDGKMIKMYLWNNVENPIGVVQLIHGMSEYLYRYDDFAKFLNDNGFIVFGDDHRAHGETAGNENNVGVYDKGKDIFEDTLKDELLILKTNREKYKDLPYFIFSHSYGSFLTQRLIQVCEEKLDGVVLCGSAYLKNAIDISFAKLITSILPYNSKGKLIEKSSFNHYNKKLNGGYWITRDEVIAKEYYSNKYCNKTFSNGFYYSMFKGMLGNYKRKNISKISQKLPLFIISGSCDPISHNGKKAVKLYEFYKKNNLKNVEFKLYDGARHELINEINRDEVYIDVLNFFNKNID